ncbi:hypothetical protein ACH4FX_12010 [Streptomyces sp. NPDC018019]|uniref:hypothetical protein n=1 Tax=Streptomyces sp. NPDC018019 TaxID=3365030 RepID=UPI0037898D76
MSVIHFHFRITARHPIAAVLRHPVRTRRLARLEILRLRLPLDDPDRHALDSDADAAFAALAVCFEIPPGGAE